MTTPPTDPKAPPPDVNIEAGEDVTIGTFVGRDAVTNTTTNVGFSYKQVQRLLITVGLLVFVTAGCFFSGGLAVGFGVFTALNKPVNSEDTAAAARFESFLAELQALPPGQPFIFNFTEKEISSYFRQTLGPQLGIRNGKVRFLDTGSLVVSGQSAQVNNLTFAATFELQNVTGAPLKLKAAALQIFDAGPLGWVAIPTSLLQPIADNLNATFGNVQLSEVEATAPQPDPAWSVSGAQQ
jgi:hypothetical protein